MVSFPILSAFRARSRLDIYHTQAEITNSADILLIVLDAALRQERSDFKPIAPAKREASPARLTTPKKVKSDSPPKPFWRLQAERLWSKVTKHEWVRNDGLQSYGGKLQWFRPTVLTQRPFLNVSELQVRVDATVTPSIWPHESLRVT